MKKFLIIIDILFVLVLLLAMVSSFSAKNYVAVVWQFNCLLWFLLAKFTVKLDKDLRIMLDEAIREWGKAIELAQDMREKLKEIQMLVERSKKGKDVVN